MKKQPDNLGKGAKGHGLTPLKVVLIYLVAFSLVSLHEVERLSSWAKELTWEWGLGAQAADPLQRIDSFLDKTGLLSLAEAESAWLDGLEFPIVGTISVSAAPGPGHGNIGREVSARGAGERTASESVESSQEPVRETPLAMLGDSLVSEAVSDPMFTRPLCGPGDAVQTPHQETSDDLSLRSPKVTPNNILIAGDSMILEGFGVALERRLKGLKGLTVVRKGRYSSGLSRPDYFNWMPYLKELLEQYRPDLLVVSLGANDPQDIIDENGKRHYVATPGWNEQYAARARQFIETAHEYGCFVFWVGLPIMGRAKYGTRIENLNQVVSGVCEESSFCTYVDTWLVLADSNGDYTTFVKSPLGKHIRIRAKDRIHLTEAGGEIMVDHFLEEAEHYVKLPDVLEEADPKEQLSEQDDREQPLKPDQKPGSDSETG